MKGEYVMTKKIIGAVSAAAITLSLFSCAGKKSDTKISKKESKLQSHGTDIPIHRRTCIDK